MLRIRTHSVPAILLLACGSPPTDQAPHHFTDQGGSGGSGGDVSTWSGENQAADASDLQIPMTDAAACTCAEPGCRGADCPEPVCGDGLVNAPDEQCDGNGLGKGGVTAECNENCTRSACGDGIVNPLAGEACDDGNGDNMDDCPDGQAGTCQEASCSDGFLRSRGSAEELDIDCGGMCRACPGTVLLSEVAVTPTAGEFIELYNGSDSDVSLGLVHIADYSTYHVFDGSKPKASDFRIHFPPQAFIAARDYVVVSLRSAAEFASVYGFYPDFDLAPSDPQAPAMLGQYTASSGLTNSDEMIMVFAYHPSLVLVQDIDYLIYGTASDRVDKTGTSVMGLTYLPDTTATLQDPVGAPSSNGQSASRCDDNEGLELKSGGNGYAGHDETSENLSRSWQVTNPTPGNSNACR